jgi:predicted metal-dependent HD superfamily phosphohydrolase
MTQPESEIRSTWRHIAGPHHDGYVDSLLIRYAEPHRHYHTATHIMLTIRHLHDMCRAVGSEASPEVLAAALYHDAIYDPTADDNEASSADIAVGQLTDVGWPAVRCDAVAAMILATAGHVTPRVTNNDDVDTTLLLDADLAILGAEPAAYQSYVNGVRAEYSHVDDAAWLAGRSAVLHRFLERPRLFATQYMHDTYEHRARANIQAELASLRRDG